MLHAAYGDAIESQKNLCIAGKNPVEELLLLCGFQPLIPNLVPPNPKLPLVPVVFLQHKHAKNENKVKLSLLSLSPSL